MTAAEHFAAQEARVDAHRAACRIVVHAIDYWCVRYIEGEGEKVPIVVRLELERIKEAMLVAGKPPPEPPAHEPGDDQPETGGPQP